MGTIESVIAAVLITGGLVYLLTCLAAFAGLLHAPRRAPGHTPQISVIIAARNEENTIGLLLDDLLAQEYPRQRIDITVVDDCSDDGTGNIVRSFAERDGRIRLADTRGSRSPYSHKKRAIHEGILSTEGEIILVTDADCRVPRGWIRGMAEHFHDAVDLVAGEVIVEGSGFMGRTESLESAGIQAMAAGLMNIGFPITCNGANLAYRRSAFERVAGFGGIGEMVSGDDDLLMQKIAAERSGRVLFLTGRDTAVRVRAAVFPGEFFSKRIRWASKIKGYPLRSTVALLSVFFMFFAAAPAALAAVSAGWFGPAPLAIGYGMKMLGDLLLTGLTLVRSGRTDLLGVFLPAELLHVPYILFVTILGCFGTFEWRGRRTGAYSMRIEGADHDT